MKSTARMAKPSPNTPARFQTQAFIFGIEGFRRNGFGAAKEKNNLMMRCRGFSKRCIWSNKREDQFDDAK